MVRVGSHKTKDAFVELNFEDSGIGFDEKYIDKNFKPFQRLEGHRHDERSGMGLEVCKLFAERLGGSISAKCSTGEGATFTVKLPMEPLAI